MNNRQLIHELREAGLIASLNVKLTPLSGGVSSDVIRVDDRDRRFVVKRALPKLRVDDEWLADVGRSGVEQDFLAYAGKILPGSVPRLLHADLAHHWFAMEFLGDNLRNWKDELMAVRADDATARLAGETLSRLHAESWNDDALRERFSTLENFTDLRIDPYLTTTASRVPEVRDLLEREAEALASAQITLVHGDFSPKNILVAPGRLVLLDAEVAWFGDPVFDVAFLHNHFFLKALFHIETPEPFLALSDAAWASYREVMGPLVDAGFEHRMVRLLLCLLLARVHGKSPVEYLTTPKQHQTVTEFVLRHLPNPPSALEELRSDWHSWLLHG